jgi:hypothetical protein
MPNRASAMFLLCLASVMLSGAAVLVAADGWLYPEGIDVGGLRAVILIWIVVVLEAPALAAASLHVHHRSAGLLGTIGGTAAVTLAFVLLRNPQSFDPGGLLFVMFFVGGVAGLPVIVVFAMVEAVMGLRRRK